MKLISTVSISIILLITACSEQKKEKLNSEIILKKVTREHGLVDQYIQKSENDTSKYWKTVKGDVSVISELTPKGITIKTINKNHQRIVNLGKLDEAYQLPRVEWISDEIVCIHTFTKKATANIFFIPYNTDKSISFFNHEMVGIAPENNVIVYISNIGNPEITYSIYNVKNKKEVSIETRIGKQEAVHPYFEKLSFKDKKAIFEMGDPNEKFTIDYSEILN